MSATFASLLDGCTGNGTLHILRIEWLRLRCHGWRTRSMRARQRTTFFFIQIHKCSHYAWNLASSRAKCVPRRPTKQARAHKICKTRNRINDVDCARLYGVRFMFVWLVLLRFYKCTIACSRKRNVHAMAAAASGNIVADVVARARYKMTKKELELLFLSLSQNDEQHHRALRELKMHRARSATQRREVTRFISICLHALECSSPTPPAFAYKCSRRSHR